MTHATHTLELAVSAMSSSVAADSSPSASDCAPETKRRKVSHATYMMWKRDLDRECRTMSWLDWKFKERIEHRRSFSERWIIGADSVRTSNIRDHSHADQHVHAMMLLKKEHAKRKE